MHPRVAVVEEAMHGILKPLGFKKLKLVWRRATPDMVQMVGLEKMTYGFPMYNFYYGLCLPRFSQKPRVPLHDADVQWSIEEKVPTESDRVRLFSALDMDYEMSDEQRTSAIRELLLNYVLPAFEATDTIEKLRLVLSDYANPFCTVLVGFERDKL